MYLCEIRLSGYASLRNWQLNKDWTGSVDHMHIWGKSDPCRGNNWGRVTKTGVYLVCSRKSKRVWVARAELERRKEEMRSKTSKNHVIPYSQYKESLQCFEQKCAITWFQLSRGQGSSKETNGSQYIKSMRDEQLLLKLRGLGVHRGFMDQFENQHAMPH